MTNEENKELLDSVIKTEDEIEVPTTEENDLEEPPEMDEADFEFGDLSSGVKKDVLLDESLEDDNLIFEIETAELSKPVLKDSDGNFIKPIAFSDNDPTKKGYKTKLLVSYKENNYISIIPNIKWYIGTNKTTGKKVLNPWFLTNGLNAEKLNDHFTSEVSKLYFRYCIKNDIEPGKLPQEDFIKKLVGCKVRVRQYADTYKGSKVYRIDVVEFI